MRESITLCDSRLKESQDVLHRKKGTEHCREASKTTCGCYMRKKGETNDRSVPSFISSIIVMNINLCRCRNLRFPFASLSFIFLALLKRRCLAFLSFS